VRDPLQLLLQPAQLLFDLFGVDSRILPQTPGAKRRWLARP
jgi:hypothetical protein